ncbi:hypothetical protein Tco_0968441 [Tanacetum coccineum]
MTVGLLTFTHLHLISVCTSFLCVCDCADIMADVNAPVEQAPALAPPTRTDEQILPRIRWVPIGKSNCYLDAKVTKQSNLQDCGGHFKHTTSSERSSASSTITAIYIQQFGLLFAMTDDRGLQSVTR